MSGGMKMKSLRGNQLTYTLYQIHSISCSKIVRKIPNNLQKVFIEKVAYNKSKKLLILYRKSKRAEIAWRPKNFLEKQFHEKKLQMEEKDK